MIQNDSMSSGKCPIIVLRGVFAVPNVSLEISPITRKKSTNSIDVAMKDNKIVILMLQKDPRIEDPKQTDLFEVGIVAQITYSMSDYMTKFLCLTRCKLLSFNDDGEKIIGEYCTLPVATESLVEDNKLHNKIIQDLPMVDLIINVPAVMNTIKNGVTPDYLADLIAFNVNPKKMSIVDRIKFLVEPNITIRLRSISQFIENLKNFKKIDDKIEHDVNKAMSEAQKEYYLREKMRIIQEELGDKAKKESEIDELRRKIKEAKMPQKTEEKALNELSRYITTNTNSMESGIIKSYLDFMIALPWSNKSADNSNLAHAKEQLDNDHYGLEKVKNRILEYLAVEIFTSQSPQAIICLVGPPGVGKTSLARSIALGMNKVFVKQSLGGVKDESEIRGHRRTYVGALPGRILNGMKKAGVINPVFLLDEVDKLSSDYKGDPASALLEVLDSEQNYQFSDHYLEEPYDLSKVFFIATANYLENIPAPLRDRMEVIELSSYTEYEKFEIAKRHLLPKQVKLHGVSSELIQIDDDALWRVIREYTLEAGVRELERVISTLIRKIIKENLLKEKTYLNVTKDNITEWLGKTKYTYSKLNKNDQIGVVTGLAYTAYGGDTLPIEATYYPGTGLVKLSGKLGEVMQESAHVAYSYVKSNAEKFEIDSKLFKENDVHIHVPEGAVPKDGPSAGITLATAIVSIFTKKKVKHSLGMTGELTINGMVLPIGGLREKSIAAARSGIIKTIIIPKDNLKDLEDIPQSIKDSIKIIPVEKIDEVIKYALVSK